MTALKNKNLKLETTDVPLSFWTNSTSIYRSGISSALLAKVNYENDLVLNLGLAIGFFTTCVII